MNNHAPKKLHEALQEARIYRDLQYSELAALTGRQGKSFGQYTSQVLRGTMAPNIKIFEELADALEVTLAYRPETGWGWRPR